MVRHLPSLGIRGRLRIHFSAARASVAVALFLGRSRILRSCGPRHPAHWKSDSPFHGVERASATGHGLHRALAKETAILAPLALGGWELIGMFVRRNSLRKLWMDGGVRTSNISSGWRIASLLCPAFPLAVCYAYHYAHTGYVFGNPEFFRYN